MTQPTPLERFQQLLRDLFEFDAADLDFGIYRILNHKRSRISDFIDLDMGGRNPREWPSSIAGRATIRWPSRSSRRPGACTTSCSRYASCAT